MPVELPLLEQPARHTFSLRVTGPIPGAPALLPGRAPVAGEQYRFHFEIESEGGLQWPFPAGTSNVSSSRLYADGWYEHEGGKAKLFAVDWQPFRDQPDREFPLVLNTGRTGNIGTRAPRPRRPILERMSPNALLEMNPDDAGRLGLKPHQRVDIESRRGRVRSVELRITQITAPGQVFMPFHFFETNVNEVTQDAFDPISREPNYKQCAVRVMSNASPAGRFGERSKAQARRPAIPGRAGAPLADRGRLGRPGGLPDYTETK